MIKKIILFTLMTYSLNTCFSENSRETFPEYALLYHPNSYPSEEFKIIKNHPPLLTTPLARYFRTRLREASQQSPDFAGNISVAEWGCGSGCLSFAFVNVQTGEVWFPDFDIFFPDYDENNVTDTMGLYYWASSNLFIVVGSKEGWADKPGVYYYLWTGKTLKLLSVIKNKNVWKR